MPDGNINRRRENDDSKILDLPRLPVRAQHERRPRLPPTLSGLYEPPPSAGLLPSISVDRPELETSSTKNPGESSNTSKALSKALPTKTKISRNKWTNAETKQLLQGVARFGIGNWTKILRCPDYEFGRRTALDLKDRFRVCCPDQYGYPVSRKAPTSSTSKALDAVGSARSPLVDLADLGIQTPFARSSRRRRHAYSEAEDQQLLKGFQTYGKSWSSIQQDASLGLGHRTRTDLRDRMRTRFPKQLDASATTDDGVATQSSGNNQATIRSPSKLQSPADQSFTPSATDIQPTSWISDPYLAPAYDDAEFDGPITLDRGILDWPLTNTTASSSDAYVPRIASLDSPSASRPPAMASALPSLATITASGGQQMNEDREMLELPALAHFFPPPLEMDDRPGAHALLSLDELLS